MHVPLLLGFAFRMLILNKASRLKRPQIFIQTLFPANEILMSSLLDNLSVLDNNDTIHLADRGQAVRDDDRRPAFHQFIKGVLNQRFGMGIETRCRLIQDQDRGIL